MALATVRRRAVNPIVYNIKRVIGEGSAFSESVVSCVGSASVVGECIQNSAGFLLNLGTPNQGIGEAVVSPVFSNIQFGTPVQAIGECLTPEAVVGGGVDIYDEGILVKAKATHIDIVGVDAQAVIDGGGVIIFHPPVAVYSHWNTSDGTNNNAVSDVAASNRYVASPTAEGAPFYSGGGVPWGGDGSTHPSTRTSPLSWSAGPCFFDNANSTFSVTVSDSTGIIASNSIANVNGDAVSTLNNITITISGWAVMGLGFEASIAVSLDVAALLPNSGYFDILMRHNSGGVNYDKSQ